MVGTHDSIMLVCALRSACTNRTKNLNIQATQRRSTSLAKGKPFAIRPFNSMEVMMEVLTADDGSFALVFSKEEKELGLAILENFTATTKQGEENLNDAKSRIIMAGESLTAQ